MWRQGFEPRFSTIASSMAVVPLSKSTYWQFRRSRATPCCNSLSNEGEKMQQSKEWVVSKWRPLRAPHVGRLNGCCCGCRSLLTVLSTFAAPCFNFCCMHGCFIQIFPCLIKF
ncbi:hypothetical protein O6H91_19G075500 [Diphasiastrum complanatum]|uniref:Uncharacterized protein n=1 Tax=Diphasiastrum complanatum TaxID=34168 RepID=A0ACC2AWR7_DIPCM|nr:hypothetical protein O6H91_19G075500 [Diphasiastrum complanatum]